MIHQILARNVAFNIIKEKAITDLMKALPSMHEKLLITNKIFLIHHLFNLKIGEGASIVDHIYKFNVITIQLSYVNIMFENDVKTLILLLS